MQHFTPSSKIKKSTSGNLTSHLSTFQGDVIRNNASLPFKKDKSNRRVITEQNQKNHHVANQIKSATKQFKLPFKSTSPKPKKNLAQSHSASNKKFAFLNSTNPKKKSQKITTTTKFHPQKVNTETGGLIKKKKINTDKRIQFTKEEKSHPIKETNKKEPNKKQQRVTDEYGTEKKPKGVVKKIKESKSQNNLTQMHKMRLKTQGTFDCTPYILGGQDIEILGLIGQGTFGKVYKGRIITTGQLVAIKRVFQDPKYKNRQVEIVQMLRGEYVMKVLGTYTTVQNGSQYLSIIMEYYDGDLFSYIKSKNELSTLDIKLITYQIFRGLNYVHSLGICHRDIKPHNILIKGKKAVICDFGSAKVLTNQPNLPYICSRCYRAPELIFGATHYNTMIDIWSVGCVILEMIQGMPLFIGESSIDHLIQIIKVMGTPTKSQVIDMNPEYDLNDYKFPKIKRKQWAKIFPEADLLLIDLISKIMIYSPNQRLSAIQALCHQFFDQLREEKTYKTIKHQYGIDLLNFTEEQIKTQNNLLAKLIPDWLRIK